MIPYFSKHLSISKFLIYNVIKTNRSFIAFSSKKKVLRHLINDVYAFASSLICRCTILICLIYKIQIRALNLSSE